MIKYIVHSVQYSTSFGIQYSIQFAIVLKSNMTMLQFLLFAVYILWSLNSVHIVCVTLIGQNVQYSTEPIAQKAIPQCQYIVHWT